MGFFSTLFTCLLVVAAVACTSPSPAVTPTQPSPTATPTVAPGPTPVPEGLFLEVTEPADESVVSTAQVIVRGRTAVDAVVTVDGLPVDVAADGSFEASVTVSEGPNTVEIIASDFEGNEETAVLALIYIP